jgi:hypothetical protein
MLRHRVAVVACVLDEQPRGLVVFIADEPEVVQAGQG